MVQGLGIQFFERKGSGIRFFERKGSAIPKQMCGKIYYSNIMIPFIHGVPASSLVSPQLSTVPWPDLAPSPSGRLLRHLATHRIRTEDESM